MNFLKLTFYLALSTLFNVTAIASDEPNPNSSFVAINQQLLTGETGTTRMIGPSGFDQEITYSDQGDYGLFEGDIMVPLGQPPQRELGDIQAPNSLVINGFLWPNNTVPYYVGGVSAKIKSDVRAAVADIEAISDVNFVELVSTSNAPYFVKVVASSGSCTSYVGYRTDFFGANGFQELQLFDGCGVEATTHEFLHALGMYHEQSRSDRDNFVGINTANIQPSLLFNFDKLTSGVTNIGPYDYDSIMHYPFWAFNINNDFETVTIFSKTNKPVTFYNYVMSPGDIASINIRYPGIEKPAAENSFLSTIISFLLD